jgi:hypothetical protein
MKMSLIEAIRNLAVREGVEKADSMLEGMIMKYPHPAALLLGIKKHLKEWEERNKCRKIDM